MRRVAAALALAAALAAAGGEALAGESADQVLELARGMQAKGLFPAAAAEYERFLRDFPEEPRAAEAQFAIGECRLAELKGAEAAEAFERARAKLPAREAETALRLGQCAYLQGKYDDAAKRLRAALDAKPPENLREGARYFLARSLAALGRKDEAAKALGEGVKSPVALLAAAELASAEGRAADAEKLCRELLAKELDAAIRAEATFRLAESLRALGRLDEASAEYGKVLAAGAGAGAEVVAAAKIGLAWTCLERSKAAEAQRLAREVRASPGAPELSDEARYVEALAGGAMGAHDEAATLLGRLAADSPRDFGRRAQAARIVELRLAGNVEEAARSAGAFLAQYKEGDDVARVRYVAACASLALGLRDEALALFRSIASLGEKSPVSRPAAYGVAASLAAAGRHEEAAEAFDAFASANPADAAAPLALLASAREYLVTAKHQAAEGLLSQVLNMASAAPEVKAAASWGLALAALRRGDAELSAKRFADYLSKYPTGENAAEALLWLGWQRRRSGATAGAIELYEKVLAEHPKAPQAREARMRLAYACAEAGRDDRASELFEKTLAEEPQSVPGGVYLWLAERRRSAGDLKKAGELLGALAGSTKDPNLRQRALHARGELAIEGKDLPAAAEAFDVLLRDYPEGPYVQSARLLKGSALRLAGRLDEAEVLLENVVRSTEGLACARAHYELGQIRLARDKADEARREFLRVVVLYRPADELEAARVWAASALAAARASVVLDDKASAAQIIRELLAEKRAARTPEAAEARKLLGELESGK